MKAHKRFFALNISIILAVVFSLLYIIAVGKSYTLHTRVFLWKDETPQTEVVFENDNVVSFEGARTENNELILEFRALNRGETDVHARFFHKESGEAAQLAVYHLKVTPFGTLIETGRGLNFNGFRAVIFAAVTVLLLVQIIMMWLFIDHVRLGLFSYPMIAYGGIAVYNLILILYLVYRLLNGIVSSFSFFILLVTDTGEVLLIALTPFMLLLSVLLMVSNIRLMRNEGYRPVNTLGIIFAVLWFLGTLVTLGSYSSILYNLWDIPAYDTIRTVLIYVIGYLECMFLSTVASSYLATKHCPPYDRDFIIILGCAIRTDGSLTPLLKARVDSAVAFEKKQFEETGKHAVFIPSGGQGADETISEGEAMENYLLSIGIPAEQIAREDKSTNTFENMAFSKRVIEQQTNDIRHAKIAFATTNYHVFRGYILANKNGFEAKGISAKTKLYFFPNAFLREFAGLLADRKWHHLMFILLTLLILFGLSAVNM